MSIVFFGTSEFAVPILENLAKSGFPPVLVITTPDALVGRKQVLTPPPVKIKSQELGLTVFQPVSLKIPEAVKTIETVRPIVGILAAYGKIVPKSIIDIFPKGILNVHPSLLPRWRGPTPIQSAILAGDEKTGITIIQIDDEIDHGPILAKRELSSDKIQMSKIDYIGLRDELAHVGADTLIEILPQWLKDAISPTPQNHADATYCRKFKREDAKIDWSKSAQEIERMVRALNPEPGTWTMFNSNRSGLGMLKVLSSRTFQHSQECKNVVAGGVCIHEGEFVVKCGEGALILELVQPEGKKPMTGEAFLRGHKDLTS